MTKKCAPAVPEQRAQHSVMAHHHGHVEQTPTAAMNSAGCEKPVQMERNAALRDSSLALFAQDQASTPTHIEVFSASQAAAAVTPTVHAPIVVPLRI